MKIMSLGSIGLPALIEPFAAAGRIKACRFQLCSKPTATSLSISGSARIAMDSHVSWPSGKMDCRVSLSVAMRLSCRIIRSLKITEIYSNVIAHRLNRYGPSPIVIIRKGERYVAKNQANSGGGGKAATRGGGPQRDPGR